VYLGEAAAELRHGAQLLLNVAPAGCMVASMGELFTPAIEQAAGRGRVQHLFSAEGDLDDELLALAMLKVLGPERTLRRDETSAVPAIESCFAPAGGPTSSRRGIAPTRVQEDADRMHLP
jgi:hypothetical protein